MKFSLGYQIQKLVRERGVEPPRVASLEPESSASTIPPLARIGNNINRICFNIKTQVLAGINFAGQDFPIDHIVKAVRS